MVISKPAFSDAHPALSLPLGESWKRGDDLKTPASHIANPHVPRKRILWNWMRCRQRIANRGGGSGALRVSPGIEERILLGAV